ncbi:MAG TPA: hypothetical protein DEV74_09585 [Acidovorax sp.]|nr:hypothetical protein [Acidovorax sp.]
MARCQNLFTHPTLLLLRRVQHCVNIRRYPGILCTNPAAKVGAADRDGLPGAKRSNSHRYCEVLQRRRPPETADAHDAVIRAEDPWLPAPSGLAPSAVCTARVHHYLYKAIALYKYSAGPAQATMRPSHAHEASTPHLPALRITYSGEPVCNLCNC